MARVETAFSNTTVGSEPGDGGIGHGSSDGLQKPPHITWTSLRETGQLSTTVFYWTRELILAKFLELKIESASIKKFPGPTDRHWCIAKEAVENSNIAVIVEGSDAQTVELSVLQGQNETFEFRDEKGDDTSVDLVGWLTEAGDSYKAKSGTAVAFRDVIAVPDSEETNVPDSEETNVPDSEETNVPDSEETNAQAQPGAVRVVGAAVAALEEDDALPDLSAVAEPTKSLLIQHSRRLKRRMLEERKGRLEEEKGRLEEKKGRLEEKKGRLEEKLIGAVRKTIVELSFAHMCYWKVGFLLITLGNAGNETKTSQSVTTGQTSIEASASSSQVGRNVHDGTLPPDHFRLVENLTRSEDDDDFTRRLINVSKNSQSQVCPEGQSEKPRTQPRESCDALLDFAQSFTALVNNSTRPEEHATGDVNLLGKTTATAIRGLGKTPPATVVFPSPSAQEKLFVQPIVSALCERLCGIKPGANHNSTSLREIREEVRYQKINRTDNCPGSNCIIDAVVDVQGQCNNDAPLLHLPLEMKPVVRQGESVKMIHLQGLNQIVGHSAQGVFHAFELGGRGVSLKVMGALVTLVYVQVVEFELGYQQKELLQIPYVKVTTSKRLPLLPQEACRKLLTKEKNTLVSGGADLLDALFPIDHHSDGSICCGLQVLHWLLTAKREEVSTPFWNNQVSMRFISRNLGSEHGDEVSTHSRNNQLSINSPSSRSSHTGSIGALAGTGAFSAVYIFGASNGTFVMKIPRTNLKILNDSVRKEQDILIHLRRELNSGDLGSLQLECPHIPVLIDLGRLSVSVRGNAELTIPATIMSPCGFPLRMPLPAEELSSVVEGVSNALRWAHDRNLAHLDVRPANIVMSEGKAVLIDWGLARSAGTIENGMVGTPPYAHSTIHVDSDRWVVDTKFDLASLVYTAVVLVRGHIPWHFGRNFAVAESVEERDTMTRESMKALDGCVKNQLQSLFRSCAREGMRRGAQGGLRDNRRETPVATGRDFKRHRGGED